MPETCLLVRAIFEEIGAITARRSLSRCTTSGGLVAWDETRGAPVTYDIGKRRYCETPDRLAISGEFVVDSREGPIRCRPAFELFAASCRAMSPEHAAAVSGVEPSTIWEAARLIWHHRPIAHYTWTGLEQHTNATQTDRAIAILHALTGSIDVPGGNVHFAQVSVNDVSGIELRGPKQWQKALGWRERQLGPAADGWITSTDLYRAVLDRQPYQVIIRGLVGFGANLLLSHPDAKRGAEALRSLEFHVQTDLYLTPTAAYADIVLPIASGWEREGLRIGFALDQRACEYVQLRPAIVPPRGEARADIDVVFDLAVSLGLADHFRNGDVESGLAHHLAPSGLTPAMLRNAPRQTLRVPLETRNWNQSGNISQNLWTRFNQNKDSRILCKWTNKFENVISYSKLDDVEIEFDLEADDILSADERPWVIRWYKQQGDRQRKNAKKIKAD